MSASKSIPLDFVSPEWVASRIKVDPATGCHVWVGNHDSSGYGYIERHGMTRVAHRVVWQLSGRTLDPTLVLDHLCRNRSCVNPDHPEQVSMRVNTSRGVGRNAAGARAIDAGHCLRGHDLSVVGFHSLNSGRMCAECGRENQRRYKARRIARGEVTR